jgi:hypothetical protein
LQWDSSGDVNIAFERRMENVKIAVEAGILFERRLTM